MKSDGCTGLTEVVRKGNLHHDFETSEFRFIKLGNGGQWEAECIEGSLPCIRLGFRSGQHLECLQGDWDAVFRYWHEVEGRSRGKATEYKNQIQQFYTLNPQTIWITFYKRKLFWCRADSEVVELEDKTRIRKAIGGGWSSQDLNGNELYVDNLSGVLTRVQGFRGTICRVEAEDYLRRRLQGQELPTVTAARNAVKTLESSLIPLIKQLGWKDFELLTDLIFTQAGWQRISSLGKTEKSIDLDLISPVTNRRAFVQVKSQATLETFLAYREQFLQMGQYDEMYFVVHTADADLSSYDESIVQVLTADRLAKLVVSAGLVNWLVRKVA